MPADGMRRRRLTLAPTLGESSEMGGDLWQRDCRGLTEEGMNWEQAIGEGSMNWIVAAFQDAEFVESGTLEG
jgi:hypothetical protein